MPSAEWYITSQNNASGGSGPGKEKATFGLVSALLVATNLATNYFISKTGGVFQDLELAITNPPIGSSASLDILISTDYGATWNSILATPIVIPAATTHLYFSGAATFSAFNAIAPHNWLRVDGLTVGSGSPGGGVEMVLQWA